MRCVALAVAGFGLASIASVASPAHAQAYQCSVPSLASLPQVAREGPVRRIPVAGYTLAASWSPEFCKGREQQSRHLTQCSGRNGRFGMILHGLWPDGRGNSWPQWCPTARTPQPATISRHFCSAPSARLQVRQWYKHGACMTRLPETYFKVGGILWRSLRWPDYDRLSRKDELTAGDIRTAFVDANPGFFAEAVSVRLDRGGWLEEIRLCYGKDFMPRACKRGRSGAVDGTKAKIWRGL